VIKRFDKIVAAAKAASR